MNLDRAVIVDGSMFLNIGEVLVSEIIEGKIDLMFKVSVEIEEHSFLFEMENIVFDLVLDEFLEVHGVIFNIRSFKY